MPRSAEARGRCRTVPGSLRRGPGCLPPPTRPSWRAEEPEPAWRGPDGPGLLVATSRTGHTQQRRQKTPPSPERSELLAHARRRTAAAPAPLRVCRPATREAHSEEARDDGREAAPGLARERRPGAATGRLSLLGGPPVLPGLVPTRAARAPRTQACVPSSNSAPCLVRSNRHRDSGAPRTEPSTRTTQGRVPEVSGVLSTPCVADGAAGGLRAVRVESEGGAREQEIRAHRGQGWRLGAGGWQVAARTTWLSYDERRTEDGT